MSFLSATEYLIGQSTNMSYFEEVIIKDKSTPANTLNIRSNGAVDIHDSDFHTELVSRRFAYFTGTSSNINAPVTAGDTSVTVVSDAAFTVGDLVYISDGDLEENDGYPVVTAKPGGNVLTLDRPLDNGYTTAGSVEIVDLDVALANGTLASPVSYKLIPPADEVWHIQEIFFSGIDNTDPTDNLFIGATALTNGIVVRKNASTDFTLLNAKSNGDLVTATGTIEYSNKAGGGGYTVRAILDMKSVSDVIMRIDGSAGEFLEVLVQDNLSTAGITSLYVSGRGHKEQA